MQQWREKLIGDRKFYRRLFRIAVPMMIQMGITNFASMLEDRDRADDGGSDR